MKYKYKEMVLYAKRESSMPVQDCLQCSYWDEFSFDSSYGVCTYLHDVNHKDKGIECSLFDEWKING